MPSPLLVLHISAAMIGLLSGALAMIFRKGSGLHGAAGNVYFGSMLIMGSSALFVAEQPIGALNGLLASYLVGTGWLTARRRSGKPGLIDGAALLLAVGTGAALVFHGMRVAASPTGRIGGYTAGIYYVFGTIALLCAVADIRMIARGGISGVRRIARHLWRMSFALLMAAGSFFGGQAKLFPPAVRKSGLLYLPILLVLGLMLFWLCRVLWTKAFKSNFPSTRPYINPRTNP
ncbi:MAG TPA: hypothetical protein VGF48_14445 [Thermoanaerobaculia bacterium]|jgi:hypothetical protein